MSEEKDIHTKEKRKYSQETVNGSFFTLTQKIVFIEKEGGNIKDGIVDF